MKDRIEQELTVGDPVVYVRPTWKDLGFGQIEKITPKRIRIRPYPISQRTWRKDYADLTDIVARDSIMKLEADKVMLLLLAGKI